MKITESGIYADINEIADDLDIALGINATFDEAQKSDILKNGIRADKLLPILKAKRAYGFERFQSLVEFA